MEFEGDLEKHWFEQKQEASESSINLLEWISEKFR